MPDNKRADDHLLGDMDAETFRQNGYALVDWIAEYLTTSERYPVLSQSKPGEIRAALPTDPPVKGTSFENIFKDFDDIILPGITHWNLSLIHI